AMIHADATETYLLSAAGGTRRYLSVDADGIWVKTTKGAPPGYFMHYNLEETAQDSGWQSFPVRAGFTSEGGLAWRNLSGVIYFRGTVRGKWTGGVYQTVVTGLPSGMRPTSTVFVPLAGSSQSTMRITPSGSLAIYRTNPSSNGGVSVTPAVYPRG